MHVIHTPVRFAPDVGGVESHVRAIGSRLVDRGHHVTVVCAEADADGTPPDRIDGIDVERLGSPFSIANTDVTPRLPLRLYELADRADVIHTHLPTPWSADMSAVVGALTDTPVVVTYHNDIVGDRIFDAVANLYNATALRVTLVLADRIVVTRPGYVAESAHLGPYGDKTVTVPNGVDLERFGPHADAARDPSALGVEPERLTLFFLAVLDEYHEYKGLDVLLEAMARLVGSGTDDEAGQGGQDREPPRLVVGGDGPRRPAYEATARRLGLADHVTFAGRIDEDDLPAAFAAADAFVLPSGDPSQEGFGLVLLEALASGTPVVTTPVVGIADDLEGEPFATLVPPDDPGALAAGIRSQLAGTADTAAGRELCRERYAWSDSVDDLEAVYRSVVR